MKRKIYTLFIALALICFSTFAQKNVIYVVDTSLVYLDHEVSAIIDAYNGGNVFSVTEQDISYVTQDNMDALNAADLIIQGRSVNSSTVIHDRWDSITVPVMYTNLSATIKGRGDWLNTTSKHHVYDSTFVIEANILIGSDPVFDGIVSPLTWWTGNYSNVDPVEGQAIGTILVESSEHWPLFARYPENVKYYPESEHTPMGPRTFIGNGYDKPDMPWRWNYWGWSDDAETIFFRELERMAGVVGTGVNDVKTNNPLSVISSNGIVTISMNNLNSIKIYSIDGKLVISKISTNDNMEISSLTKGIYFVKALANGSVFTKKFLVKE